MSEPTVINPDTPDWPEPEPTGVVDTDVIDSETGEVVPERVQAETALAHRTEQSAIDALMHLENATEIIERRASTIEALTRGAVSATEPEDWVANKDKTGKITAFPNNAACKVLGRYFGVEISNVRPRNEWGDFEPRVREVTNGEGKQVTEYACWLDAYCRVTDREQKGIKAVRYSDEKFIGRTVFNGPNKGRAMYPADLESATYTLGISKAVRILAVGRVPYAMLEQAWADHPTKSVERVTKGHGFSGSRNTDDRSGASSEQTLTDKGREKAKGLAADIMGIVKQEAEAAGNEGKNYADPKERAGDIMQMVTRAPEEGGFKGYRTIRNFKADWQVSKACEALLALVSEGALPQL